MTATEPKYKEVHIVDDNDVDTYISQHLLEEIGFASKISISTNGAEALEYLKSLGDQQPDVIFLRNVLIYFSAEQKNRIVQQLTKVLKPGGLLIVGHSESLHDANSPLKCVQSSVYKKSSL